MKASFAVALLIMSAAAMAGTNNIQPGGSARNNPGHYGGEPGQPDRTVQCSGKGDKYECEQLLQECLRDTAGLKVQIRLECSQDG
jgi:hypothetical protein